MKLSVVVPAYNESDRLPPSLETIFAFLDRHHPGSEVVVVDDGSTDDTVAKLRQRFGDRPGLTLLSYSPNRGKGYAVRYGLRHAQGDAILFSDADLSTPIEEVDKMLPRIA